jgi:hypothetical protein
VTAAWVFGEEPLEDAAAFAVAARRLVSSVLALETSDPELSRLTADIVLVAERLESEGPSDLRPRVGVNPGEERRVYVDHSRAIGRYNPVFPEYSLEVEGDTAVGRVNFPLAYEGPPGLVHGGFLALLLDCAVQHHNCDVGVAGKTASLSLRYRRPVPLLTELSFTVARRIENDRIHSSAKIIGGSEALCLAEVVTVVTDHASLPAVSPRRCRDS